MTGARILLATALALGAGELCAQTGRKPEYFLKAEYMTFVGQASTHFGTQEGEAVQAFRLGVVGRSPFEGFLAQVYEKRTIHGKPVKVVFPRTPEEVAACQMIFICRSEADRLEEVLGWVKGRPVVTVGDSKGFLSRGVMVNFVLEQDRIVIWVNLEAVKRGNLGFAPDFLELVRIFSGREGG
jgi:hypothetical protein